MLRGGFRTKNTNKLASLIKVVSAFVLFSFLNYNYMEYARAASMTPRSVTIGSSLPSEVTYHNFRFTTLTGGFISSIVFEYCSNLPFYGTPCTTPLGLDVDNSILTTQSGITGFSISAPDTTASRIVLTKAPAMSAPVLAEYRFDNITNQSTTNQTIFVRISTHGSADGTGPQIDEGAVAYATVEGVGVGGYVPPYLTFCVGVNVALNCSTADGSLLNFGELSESTSSTVSSQFAGATNDSSGYAVYITGGTMTSGNEIIPPLTNNAQSQIGTSQFGINLVGNNNPSAGSSVEGTGTSIPATGYDVVNSFRYNTGERIAGTTLPTNPNRFTITYLVNVSADQPPGVYASSFTYTAVASF